MSRITRRILLLHSAAGLAGLAAADVFGDVRAGTVRAAGPRKDVVFGNLQEPSTMNPLVATGSVEQALMVLCGPYIESVRNEQLEPINEYVEQVPSVANGLLKMEPGGAMEVTWRLHKDVRWHDGTPMTADDLVFTWNLWRDPHAPFPVGDTVKSVESVRKADARTVVVRHPHPTIRANLDWLGAFPAVVPKHVVEPMVRRVGIVRFAQIPYGQDPQATIGAGPFVLKSWTKGNEMVFEANPGYHLGRPVLDRIVFRFFSDANTLVANFAAGSLDAASPAPGGIPLAQALEIEGLLKQQRVQGYTVSYTPAPASETYFTNLENPHLRDKRVRQALLYASNREGIVQAIFNGRVPVAHSFVPPNHPWYLKDIKKYPYDPTKARQLLDEAGFRAGPDGIRRNAAGERLSLVVTAPAGDKTRERIEQILQQQWKDAGIELVIANKPIRTILAEIWSFRTRPPDFINFTLAVDDLHDIDFNWASWNIAPVGQRSNLNVSGFRNAEADQILGKYETTLDRGQRKQLYAEFQRLWAEEVPDFLLYNNSGAAVRRDGFIDLRPVGLAYTPGYWTWNARRWRWAR